MIAVCLTCGIVAQVEAHHVAGRHNHRTLTVLVCVDCHRILTAWQLTAGTELRAETARDPLDATRALLIGALHVLRLFGQRHQDRTWLPTPLVVLSARACSRVLDGLGDPGRDGRWLPDPAAPLADVTPVPVPGDPDRERTREWACLVRDLAVILGELPPLTVDTLTEIASRPGDLAVAFAAIAADRTAATLLAVHLRDFIDRAGTVTRRLLTVDVADFDEQLLREGADCVEAGRRLAQTILDLARDVAGRPGRGAAQ